MLNDPRVLLDPWRQPYQYDPKQLHLRCSSCSLELRAVAHQDLMRIRKTHEEPDPEYRGPDDDADSDYL